MTAGPYIGVVGPGDASPGELVMAQTVGEMLAARAAVLVCGGLGGVMAAACQGAYEHGGTTVGLLPDTDRANANPFLTVAIATGLGEMRNALVVRAVDAVIGIGGGWGTLSELALARRTATPVFQIASWEACRPAGGAPAPIGVVVGDPAEAVERAIEAATSSGSGSESG